MADEGFKVKQERGKEQEFNNLFTKAAIVEVIGGITKATIDYAEEAEKIKSASAALNLLAEDLDKQIKAGLTVKLK
jgi:hypothetical protein